MRRNFDPTPYRQLLQDFEQAALEDVGIAITIAKASSALADRRGRIKADRNGNPRKAPTDASEAAERRAEMPEHAHGSLNGYTNHRCRCTACVEAARVYRAARKARRN